MLSRAVTTGRVVLFGIFFAAGLTEIAGRTVERMLGDRWCWSGRDNPGFGGISWDEWRFSGLFGSIGGRALRRGLCLESGSI
jgi:hypothetical protein